jgi:hypothetical protein
LDDTITVAETTGALKFSDNGTKMQYMLAATSVIPSVPELKALPLFDAEVTLDDEFVNKFIKSKGALSDSDTFTFIYKGGKGEVVLGFSSINSNRISLSVNCKCEIDIEPIAFSAKYLKAILMANRGSNASSLKISSKGLAHVSFNSDEFSAEYYLVETK